MMRHRWAIVCASVAIGFGNFAPTSAGSRQAATEWTTLFDGRNLDHWNAIGTANWRLADGGVEANTGTGFLVTKQPYGDFLT